MFSSSDENPNGCSLPADKSGIFGFGYSFPKIGFYRVYGVSSVFPGLLPSSFDVAVGTFEELTISADEIRNFECSSTTAPTSTTALPPHCR